MLSQFVEQGNMSTALYTSGTSFHHCQSKVASSRHKTEQYASIYSRPSPLRQDESLSVFPCSSSLTCIHACRRVSIRTVNFCHSTPIKNGDEWLNATSNRLDLFLHCIHSSSLGLDTPSNGKEISRLFKMWPVIGH